MSVVDFSLEGKVAIVTGGSRGIGRSIAIGLAEAGANVAIAARKPEAIEEAVAAVNATGRRGIGIPTNVRELDSLQTLVDQTKAKFGRVDILVNNAAAARGADRVPLLELDPEVFQRVIDIKITGSYLMTKYFVQQLVAQGEGGKIVNLSSSAGKRGTPNTLAYNASNFAVIGMTQGLARELGPYGINVNCVCPGAVDTHRMDDLGRSEIWQQMAEQTPIGRNGTDAEVGDFIAYLCTEAASWIHGQSININGGTVVEH